MRPSTFFTPAVAAMLVFAWTASPRAGQDPWERVRNVVSGTALVITTTAGTAIEGVMETTTEQAMLVRSKSGGQRAIPRSDVQTVSTVKRDPVWTGIVAGAALGFGSGSALGAAWFHGSGRYGAKPPGYAREFITGVGVLGSIAGALIGWRLDVRSQQREVIYEARPSSPAAGGVQSDRFLTPARSSGVRPRGTRRTPP